MNLMFGTWFRDSGGALRIFLTAQPNFIALKFMKNQDIVDQVWATVYGPYCEKRGHTDDHGQFCQQAIAFRRSYFGLASMFDQSVRIGPEFSFFFVIVRSGPSFPNFPVLIRSYHTERFWSVDPCLHGTLIDLLRVNRTLKPYLRHKKKPNFRILRIFRITVDWLSIVISIYCNSSN